MRASDLFGRLGGEEFAAVLSDTSREKALAVAERIRATFRRSRRARSTAAPVGATVSIGMVFSDDGAFDVPELLAQADQALYFAKERGRNRVEVATLDLVLRQREREAAAAASPLVSGAANSAAKTAA